MRAEPLSAEDQAVIDAAWQRQAERYLNSPIPGAVAERLLLAILQQIRRRPALAVMILELLSHLQASDPSVADALRGLLERPHGLD